MKKDKKNQEFIKGFIKGCKPGRMTREELGFYICEHQRDLIGYFIKRGHLYNRVDSVQEAIDEVFDKMKKAAFPKAIKAAMEDDFMVAIEPDMVTPIAYFLDHVNNNREDYNDDIEDVEKRYIKIIKELMKPRVKKVSEKVKLSNDVLREILMVVPSEQYTKFDEKNLPVYIRRVTKKLYVLADTDTMTEKDFKRLTESNNKTVKKLFDMVFGKDKRDSIITTLLLEKKDLIKSVGEKGQAIWNSLTSYALNSLEDKKRVDIKKSIIKYSTMRHKDDERNYDSSRRIQFNDSCIDSELYPKITKVYKELITNPKYSNYL